MVDRIVSIVGSTPDDLFILLKDMGDGTHAPVRAVVVIEPVPLNTFSEIATGELAGAVAAVRMPNVACKFVKFKATTSNAGNIYIGDAGVTVPNGVTDLTTGLELLPADESGWIPIDNLNRFYRICDNLGDDLTYLALVS